MKLNKTLPKNIDKQLKKTSRDKNHLQVLIKTE